MMTTKEAKARHDGANEERRKILELVKRRIDKYESLGNGDEKTPTDRIMNRIFAEILGELKTEIRFADWTELGID